MWAREQLQRFAWSIASASQEWDKIFAEDDGG
jgi:hypothetical protein